MRLFSVRKLSYKHVNDMLISIIIQNTYTYTQC